MPPRGAERVVEEIHGAGGCGGSFLRRSRPPAMSTQLIRTAWRHWTALVSHQNAAHVSSYDEMRRWDLTVWTLSWP